MNKLRSIMGYLVAALSLLIILAVLPAIMFLPQPFLTATGLKLSPNYSGGEVVQTVDHAGYKTLVHRMVFDDTLIGERKEGFIQVNWTPFESLPSIITEEIDANGDGAADFRIEVEPQTRETSLVPYSDWVLGIEGSYKPGDSLMVRVKLRNINR
jgi:hypothetical protein